MAHWLQGFTNRCDDEKPQAERPEMAVSLRDKNLAHAFRIFVDAAWNMVVRLHTQ
jgi:hypothetical protein